MTETTPSLRKVLVIIDPAEEVQYALRRVELMNDIIEGGVDIHLFISVEMDKLGRQAFEFHCDNEWFANLVKPLHKHGINYTAEVYWTEDWQKSVLNAVERHGIDAIVMSDYTTEEHQNDMSAARWALLRVAPCPVLIVHPSSQLHRKTILGAVNMQTDNPSYVDLNRNILKVTQMMAKSYGAEKHTVNAYEDSMEFPDRAMLLRETDTVQENLHVQMGDPETIIATVADDIDADVVVIGTLSRRGLRAAMRGNTSERIIKRLNRDVMVLNSTIGTPAS
ncbi:universal stress protein [Emcibacter sp.]|uniref:universal stress protein n=1 Tax=Emcibacter sp. TaxID=1979954 RepID=UPI002AA6EC66|nr:universal stress protein [Emcibacter sp.]